MRTQQILYGAAAAIGLLILILLLTTLARGGDDDGPRARRPGAQTDFSAAMETALPASVMLSAPGEQAPDAMPMGSGFVVSPEGLIVTAAHVTDGLPVVNVVFFDGAARQAELVGVDEQADIAVFRVATVKPMAALELADSTQVKPGEPVVLVGAPFGLPGSATSGIVSAVGRRLTPTDLASYIQTDAALTAGGSGGPLVDSHGHVIGVATARLSRGDPGAGLAFAIPSNVVQAVLDRVSPRTEGAPTTTR